MRKNYIVKIMIVLLVLFGMVSCKDKTSKQSNNELVIDSNIAALTKPVNAQVMASIAVITAEKGSRIFPVEINGVIGYDSRNNTSISSRVSGRIEQLLIKYNYQPVNKGQLIMQVYSPDLAAAQRELLYIARSGEEHGMLDKAKQRLLLLGIHKAQIEQVLKTGNILYRVPVYSNSTGYILDQKTIALPAAAPIASPANPAGDGMSGMGAGSSLPAQPAMSDPASSPVLIREGQYISAGQPLFTIYQAKNLVAEFSLPPALAAQVKRGQKIVFYSTNDKSNMASGTIGLIEPVFRNGQNFTLARVYLDNSRWRVGQLLTAAIPVVYHSGWWLPQKAVWNSGNRTILFKKVNNVFIPLEVKTGAVVKGMVQIQSDITDWQVASNASYLVDSESFIKTGNNAQQ